MEVTEPLYMPGPNPAEPAEFVYFNQIFYKMFNE
jgi:hypothetical protein